MFRTVLINVLINIKKIDNKNFRQSDFWLNLYFCCDDEICYKKWSLTKFCVKMLKTVPSIPLVSHFKLINWLVSGKKHWIMVSLLRPSKNNFYVLLSLTRNDLWSIKHITYQLNFINLKQTFLYALIASKLNLN